MPDWLPIAYPLCGLLVGAVFAIFGVISSGEVRLSNVFETIFVATFWPIVAAIVLVILVLGAVVHSSDIVLYRRKKEPLPDLPPGEEALLEPVITPYHRASDALLTPHKESK